MIWSRCSGIDGEPSCCDGLQSERGDAADEDDAEQRGERAEFLWDQHAGRDDVEAVDREVHAHHSGGDEGSAGHRLPRWTSPRHNSRGRRPPRRKGQLCRSASVCGVPIVPLWACLLAVAVCAPLFARGYVLSYDMVWVPHLDLDRAVSSGGLVGVATCRAVRRRGRPCSGAVMPAALVQRHRAVRRAVPARPRRGRLLGQIARWSRGSRGRPSRCGIRSWPSGWSWGSGRC